MSCCYKINFDGAVFRDRGEAGLGVVIRDVNGLPMAALVQKLKYPHSVEAVEAIATRTAVQFALDIRIQEGEVEGDSETIVNALMTEGQCPAPFGLAIEDAKTLSTNFTKIQF